MGGAFSFFFTLGGFSSTLVGRPKKGVLGQGTQTSFCVSLCFFLILEKCDFRSFFCVSFVFHLCVSLHPFFRGSTLRSPPWVYGVPLDALSRVWAVPRGQPAASSWRSSFTVAGGCGGRPPGRAALMGVTTCGEVALPTPALFLVLFAVVFGGLSLGTVAIRQAWGQEFGVLEWCGEEGWCLFSLLYKACFCKHLLSGENV